MATNIGISSTASSSGLNTSAMNFKPKSWDEKVTEFSSNMKDKKAFSESEARFFVIKRNEEDFSKTSP